MKKSEISDIFVRMNAETSYTNKTFEAAKKNILFWEKELRKYKLDKYTQMLFGYILSSRMENINIFLGMKNKTTPRIKNDLRDFPEKRFPPS